MFNMLKNNKGIALIVVYILTSVLMVLGAAFFWNSFNENKLTQIDKYSMQAFAVAEAGIERTILDFLDEFQDTETNNQDPTDLIINGWETSETPDEDGFYEIAYNNTSVGNEGGSYVIGYCPVTDNDNHARIRSTGTVMNVSRTIEVYITLDNLNIWDNAIFAGGGAVVGSVINGNVDIRGSVHILGDGYDSDEVVVNFEGGGNIGNNYEDISDDLADIVPDLPTTMVNDIEVETLNAKLRVKVGLVDLDGAAQVGDDNDDENSVKETMDAVYSNDGFGDPSEPPSHDDTEKVYSDNGTSQGYDLGDSVEFPSMDDEYGSYASYWDFLDDISDSVVVLTNEYEGITPGDSISRIESDDGTSYIELVQDPTNSKRSILQIQGMVYITDENNFSCSEHGNKRDIYYEGVGSIIVSGNVSIGTDFRPNGAGSFPTNIIGFMTDETIEFTNSQIDVAGLFYAETKIESSFQTEVAGTFVTNQFDMSAQVPSIYQVPDTLNSMPPNMIGNDSTWVTTIVAWIEL